MGFTPWTILQDLGLIAILVLLGQISRAKIGIFQKLLIPAPLIAGFLGLLLGPNVMGIIPFSAQLGTYASILIVVVFAAMPIGQKVTKSSIANKNVGGMFFNVTGMLLLQYGLGTLIGLFLFEKISPAFGIILPVGFSGGHGTAAAVGSILGELGWSNATDFGMTSATAGIIGGIIFGVVLINWGARKGYTSYVKEPSKLSDDLLRGVISPEKQNPSGKITISSICLDTMTFHLCLILVAAVAGYFSAKYSKVFFPSVTLPDFCMAMIFGFIIQNILDKSDTSKYVDHLTITRISGCATDLLVVCGVASVKVAVLAQFLVPLTILFTFGYVLVIAWFNFVAPLCSDKDWFERGMIAFGQATGVLATGILLLRIVDPDLKSDGIKDSGTINLLNRPIVIGLQTFMPILLMQSGMIPYYAGWGCLILFAVLLAIAIKFKWIRTPSKLNT